MDWIEKFGHEVVRINENCQIINITSSFYESENNFTFVLNDGRRISSQNVSSFWFRRGGLRFSQSHFPTMNQSIGINVTNHLKDEILVQTSLEEEIMRNFFHPKYIYSEQYLFNKDTFLQSVFNHR